jgi:hypothetical protein
MGLLRPPRWIVEINAFIILRPNIPLLYNGIATQQQLALLPTHLNFHYRQYLPYKPFQNALQCGALTIACIQERNPRAEAARQGDNAPLAAWLQPADEKGILPDWKRIRRLMDHSRYMGDSRCLRRGAAATFICIQRGLCRLLRYINLHIG